MMPILLIKDLDLIKQLTIKDFDHFTNRRPFVTEENEPIFGKNLISLQGEIRTTYIRNINYYIIKLLLFLMIFR